MGALSEMEDETAEADKESEAAVNTENVAAVENAETSEKPEE